MEKVKPKKRKKKKKSTSCKYSQFIGFKTEKRLKGQLADMVKVLKNLGHSDCNESKLCRVLIEYRIENAIAIWKQLHDL